MDKDLYDAAQSVKRELQSFGPRLVQRLRDDRQEEIDFQCDIERQNNIAKAAVAMLDAGLPEETVQQMLQKHWDLRLSETKDYISWAHQQLPEPTPDQKSAPDQMKSNPLES